MYKYMQHEMCIVWDSCAVHEMTKYVLSHSTATSLNRFTSRTTKKNILICKRNNSMGIINQSSCYYSMLAFSLDNPDW